MLLITNNYLYSQETLPIYTDYLTDNIYLIHPTAAGISDYGKIRLTARKQWLDYKNAPSLQTLSLHTHIGNNSAIGISLYNDKNGHFSQKGGQLSYAYHINLDRHKTHQFSFALSLIFINNELDGRDFNLIDSDIDHNLVNGNYFNTDLSLAYRLDGFYTFYTSKNIIKTVNKLYDNNYNVNNLRRHLLTLGYKFNFDKDFEVKYQPSVMIQYIEATKESFVDLNMNVNIPLTKSKLILGLSYRNSLNSKQIQTLSNFTPFMGIKIKNYVASYSYTMQFGNILFTNSGFHQITLGFNIYTGSRFQRSSTWDL
jgi:type IX secretion system PorP/SprF family membrane protein